MSYRKNLYYCCSKAISLLLLSRGIAEKHVHGLSMVIYSLSSSKRKQGRVGYNIFAVRKKSKKQVKANRDNT